MFKMRLFCEGWIVIFLIVESYYNLVITPECLMCNELLLFNYSCINLCFFVSLFPASKLPSCNVDMFLCNNSRCIPKRFVCDQDDDCGDSSDEQSNCTQPNCSANEMSCNNQRCVLLSWKCDGNDDCGDMTDELNCCRLKWYFFQWLVSMFRL